MQIIYNKDGSIKILKITEYVNQGSSNENFIFVAVESTNTNIYTATANFTLPNGDTNTVSGVLDTQEVDGTSYTGYKIALSSAQTLYAGNLLCSVSVIKQSSLLNTYSFVIVVNKTGVIPADIQITGAQYQALLTTLLSYQEKYGKENGRVYENETLLIADKNNLAVGQIVFVKDTNGILQAKYVSNANHTLTDLYVSATTNWGAIGGVLTNQTDLVIALAGKQNALSDDQMAAVNSGINAIKVNSYNTHIASESNPHNVSKAQVGLGNVDNTSDLNKPISTATQTELDNVRAVAEGKTKAYILSYNETIQTVKARLNHKVFDAAGTEITTEFDSGTYDDYTIGNADFNSQNATVYFESTKWYLIIIKGVNGAAPVGTAGDNYVLISGSQITSTYKDYFKVGDEFLVIETSVPDRWFAGYSYCRTLETKSDLTNYYTKAECDSNYIKGVQVGGTDLVKDANGKVNVPIASTSELGVVGADVSFNTNIYNGKLYALVNTFAVYGTKSDTSFISKGTLENVLDNETIRVDKAQVLTETQKAQARANIGAGEDSYAHKITVW